MDSSVPPLDATTETSSDATLVQNPTGGSTRTYPVSVSVNYWIPGHPENGSPAETTVWREGGSGLLPDLRSSALPDAVPLAKPSAGDFTYSGVHDHGPLPIPREGGPMSSLISFVSEAKKANDEYLTQVIENEKSICEREEKRAKVHDQ